MTCRSCLTRGSSSRSDSQSRFEATESNSNRTGRRGRHAAVSNRPAVPGTPGLIASRVLRSGPVGSVGSLQACDASPSSCPLPDAEGVARTALWSWPGDLSRDGADTHVSFAMPMGSTDQPPPASGFAPKRPGNPVTVTDESVPVTETVSTSTPLLRVPRPDWGELKPDWRAGGAGHDEPGISGRTWRDRIGGRNVRMIEAEEVQVAGTATDDHVAGESSRHTARTCGGTPSGRSSSPGSPASQRWRPVRRPGRGPERPASPPRL